MSDIRIDALLPPEMAARAEHLGVRKAETPFLKMFMLAILAGAFIALGAIFATTVSAGGILVTGLDGTVAFNTGLPYGMTRLLTGFAFSLGLILVVVGGAELFTGSNLIVMAWANGKGDRTRAVAQLGHCLSGKLCRFDWDCSSNVPHQTIHLWRELSRDCRFTDWCGEGRPDLYTS